MSSRRLTVAIAGLCVLGAAIAGYLTWVHFAELQPYCVGGGGGCERVQSSPYAKLAGIPVALLGLAGYLAVLASLALPERSATAFLALVGMGFSGYLTYLELAVIDAVCQWCVASTVVMTALAVAAVARLLEDEASTARSCGEPPMSCRSPAATLGRMSLDPTLSVRRWFERRPVILAAAVIGFAAVGTAARAVGDPALGVLYVLPVMLAALELGLLGGLIAAAAASALVVAGGTLAPAVAAVAVGTVAGRFGDQMRAVLAREQRLIEQRSGFGRLLDAQEDDRRRHADTLHEELAQVLAAVLMSLRTLRRRGVDEAALEELDGQVVGVLDGLRDIATELRPSSLAQLGLAPALEALEGLTVEADGLPEPVLEPVRTGVYRLIEHVLSAAEPGARARLSASDSHLSLTLDADVAGVEPVTAARARVALLNGSLHAESLPASRTRLRVRLPLQAERAPVAPTGSVARMTVRPAAESISS